MNRHPDAETLSAYLDRELEVSRLREVDLHLAGCDPCRAHLASLRGVVGALDLLGRATPPADLAQGVQRRIATATPAPPLLARLGAWTVLPGFGPGLVAALGLVLAVGMSLLGHEVVEGSRARALALEPPRVTELISSYPGDPLFVPQTTSEVAGRVFVLTNTSWVERGLEGDRPDSRVDVASPRGRELLAHYRDLGYLVADGTPVMLRYQRGTVELYDWGAYPAAWRPGASGSSRSRGS